jgi:hypothetical protein
VGDAGVIMLEICCTLVYVGGAIAVLGTTDVVCSGYVTVVLGDDDAF